jgi:hypothetical protein
MIRKRRKPFEFFHIFEVLQKYPKIRILTPLLILFSQFPAHSVCKELKFCLGVKYSLHIAMKASFGAGSSVPKLCMSRCRRHLCFGEKEDCNYSSHAACRKFDEFNPQNWRMSLHWWRDSC